MNSRNKNNRLSRKERLKIEQEINTVGRNIADKKESMLLKRMQIEKLAARARDSHRLLQILSVRALGVEDANERSKINMEIVACEREASDCAFALATLRSDARRMAKLLQGLANQITAVRKSFDS